MGRATNRLTVTAVKAGAGRMQDGGGLFIDREGAGGKWTYRYSLAGVRRDMGLGAWPEVSLAEARKDRDRWAGVLRAGQDPISERNRVRAQSALEAATAAPMLADVVAEVFAAKKDSLRGEGERGRWLSPLASHILPKLGKRPISAIHQTDVRDVLRPIWKTKPDVARKAARRLRIVFRSAKIAGMAVDPFTVDAAVELLGQQPRIAQQIVATPWDRIPALYAALAGPAPARLALRMLILTAARSAPVRGMRLDEIDGDVWTVPAERMKGAEYDARPFRIPLSAEALRVLEEAAAYAVGGYLFTAQNGVPITQNATLMVLNRLGEPGRPHGFRTSFRTWAQDTQACPREVAETALAHVVGTPVERAYARSDLLEQRRTVMEAWGRFVAPKAPPA